MAALAYQEVERPDSPPIAYREVASLPLRHLAELPLATTLRLAWPLLDAVVGHPVELLLTTSRQRMQRAAREASEGGWVVCLSPLEYELVAVALADGRMTAIEAAHAVAHKLAAWRQGREHRLHARALLGPVRRPDGGGERWTLGELLEALRASLAPARGDGSDGAGGVEVEA